MYDWIVANLFILLISQKLIHYRRNSEIMLDKFVFSRRDLCIELKKTACSFKFYKIIKSLDESTKRVCKFLFINAMPKNKKLHIVIKKTENRTKC